MMQAKPAAIAPVMIINPPRTKPLAAITYGRDKTPLPTADVLS